MLKLWERLHSVSVEIGPGEGLENCASNFKTNQKVLKREMGKVSNFLSLCSAIHL